MHEVMLLLCLLGPAKIDPEPPPRTPAGEWRGSWGRTPFKAWLSPGGLYYEEIGRERWAGVWEARGAVLVIREGSVPVAPFSSGLRFTFTLSRCRRKADCSDRSVKMRRVGR